MFYDETPTLDASFFTDGIQMSGFVPSDYVAPPYNFDVQLTYREQGMGAYGSVGHMEAHAVTYPSANATGVDGFSVAFEQYHQATWTISGYYAALLQSRLRREVGLSRGFDRYTNRRQNSSQVVTRAVEAEWAAALREFAEATVGGVDPVMCIGFTSEYARAIDTITSPDLVYGKSGLVFDLGAGAAFHDGGLRRVVAPVGSIFEMTFGYLHDRWSVQFLLNGLGHRVADGTTAPEGVDDDRAGWLQVGLQAGYSPVRRGRWLGTVHAALVNQTLSSGNAEDDNQVDFRTDAGYGFGAEVSYGLGSGTGVSALTEPFRHPFRLALKTMAYRTTWIDGTQGFAVCPTLGLQMQLYTFRYAERR